jgi:hypothetical protein
MLHWASVTAMLSPFHSLSIGKLLFLGKIFRDSRGHLLGPVQYGKVTKYTLAFAGDLGKATGSLSSLRL